MTRQSATFIGFIAVLLWALLTLMGIASAPTPPFLLNGLSFTIAGIAGLIWIAARGAWSELRQVTARVYLFGCLGIFGYHFLFFSAIRIAPAAEASLINYLWPLFIVLFSGLLPGEKLSNSHVLGAVIAFVGAALIVSQGSAFSADTMRGYILAFCAALAWATYSVVSRRLGAIPTSAVAVFCLMSAALSFACHAVWEDTQLPQTTLGWLAIVGLGLGPAGGAFYVWDVGVKRGNIQLLGTASYAAPVLSTAILIAAGFAEPSPVVLISALLITAGAAITARSSSS